MRAPGVSNAPRLETEELELGIEFQLDPALEITTTYGWASRKEADERRLGQAEDAKGPLRAP